MSETKLIPTSNLLMDIENPRFEDDLSNQLDAIQTMSKQQKEKIVTLCQDILKWGLNPVETFLVMSDEQDNQKYIVLEGNRRLTALRLMASPISFLSIFSQKLRTDLLAIHAAYQEKPITAVNCLVVNNREEARHWIELRHAGELGGAGIVRWQTKEAARFRQRIGNPEIHLQVLDFVNEYFPLAPEERSTIPISSLRRIIETKHIANQFGYEIVEGNFQPTGDVERLARFFKRVISDLACKKVITRDIYRKEDRIKYIDDLIAELEPSETNSDTATDQDSEQPGNNNGDSGQETASSSPKTASRTQSRQTKTGQTRSSRPDNNRINLISPRFKLKINHPRLNNIFHELQKLNITAFPNAACVLFRVFLELSIDDYITRHQIDFTKTSEDRSYILYRKYEDVGDDLKKKGKLTQQQIKAVARAIQRDSFLAFTVSTMHEYVHNPYFNPAPADLRVAWDNVEGFVKAMWDN